MGFFDVKPKRKAFTITTKRAAIERQGGKCAKCGKRFTVNNKAQFDHKNGKNWENGLRNCQALHAGCHDAKSRKQSTTRNKVTKRKKAGKKPLDFGGVFKF